MTMIELLVVLSVVAATLASALVMLDGDAAKNAACAATTQTMTKVRGAIVGDGMRPGYRADMMVLPDTIADLLRVPPAYLTSSLAVFNPVTRLGWNGPYFLSTAVDSLGIPLIVDAWNSPLILQRTATSGYTLDPYVRIVSAGPNGIVETPEGLIYPSRAVCGDDLVLYLTVADLRPESIP